MDNNYRRLLYEFILTRLSQKEQTTKLSEYETCVALSGIINVRMKDADIYFDQETLANIKVQCTKSSRLERDPGGFNTFAEADEVDYERLANQATLLKSEDIKENGLKPVRTAALAAELSLIRAQVRPDPTTYENIIVSTWRYVLSLFSKRRVNFISGEIPSRATKRQTACLGEDMNIDISKGSGGKRLDLQCRVGKLDISNSEFKRCDPSEWQTDRVVGLSVEMYELQALHVEGWTVIVLCLKQL
ncbi:MAG: hypothetical protein J3Q66DRAFT_374923 [Benniella sp.]|nr:MAG: hypothetical protein J3Q66DRAFT_374923 [Benniella sp.]